MYLSRVALEQRSRLVRRDISDCHKLHSRVMSAFPDLPDTQNARAELGVLYRLDLNLRNQQSILLVQSRDMPDWSVLPHGYVATTINSLANPAIKPISKAWDSISRSDILRFRLQGNTSKRIHKNNPQVTDGKISAGKRVALLHENDQIDWLHRKGQLFGFEVLSVQANSKVPNLSTSTASKIHGQRTNTGNAVQRISFGSVTFEGVLRIKDRELFRKGLEVGIGPGKAYGFGLLSVAKAS
ncbi:type I-E CRISPR-associated protein Cas6/Cse3/CasE [SAR202 cluster bacterium AD-804-J14_MRT_500m]|nr:type I-E CRISPR-associated protein Cas6/Cse3/CasE [SAR202 cluster bacterium AD-804-J14_MRT_500m]